MAAPSFARFKKVAQRGGVGLVGAHFNRVNVGGTQRAQHLLLMAGALFGKGVALAGIERVDLQQLARFGVCQHQPAQRRQLHFKTVHHLDGDHVVPPVGLPQRRQRVWPQRRGRQMAAGSLPAGFHGSRALLEKEIRDHHHDGMAMGQAVQYVKRLAESGSAPGRLEEQDFADDPQHVAASLLGRDILFHFFGEKDQAHLVVVADGGESEHRGDLGGHLALGLRAGPENSRSAQIHQQHEGQLAFLHIFFDEGMVHPRRHVPINGADIVARLVFAHLLEVHALPLEDAMILPAERLGDQPRGAQLDLAYLLKDFARDHGNCGLRFARGKNSACVRARTP